MADRIELEGRERVFWGRREGKSGFVMEIEGIVERMNQMTSETNLLNLGDEVGRRTDQLNAMALLGAEIIIGAKGNHLVLETSHCNPLNRLLGPLFRSLGVEVNWSTMAEFRLTGVDEKTPILSMAFERAIPFLPETMGRFWAREHGLGSSEIAFGEEYLNRGYGLINQERLLQIGWLKRTWKILRTDGLAKRLFGFDFRSRERNQLSSFEERAVETLTSTLFSPRWEQIKKVSHWLDILEETDQEVAGQAITDLAQLARLQLYILRYLRSLRKDPGEGVSLNEWLSTIKKAQEKYSASLSYCQSLLPGLNWETAQSALNRLSKIKTIEEFAALFTPVVDTFIIAESLRALAGNWQDAGLTKVIRDKTIELKGVWGWGLAEILGGQEKVVANDIVLENPTLFSGPQGSGKTEAIFALAESLLAATLWGRTTAELAQLGNEWEVLPLITVPEWAENYRGGRPLSSFEREARDRLGLVAEFCESLPPGTRPIILLDEPFSSTNTTDASEGIRALLRYLEEKEGLLILATHCYEVVWDLEKERYPFSPKYVGLFTTPETYQWFDGHGESMGIEVAAWCGMPEEAVEIAEIIRDYLIAVLDRPTPPERLIKEYTKRLRLASERVLSIN